MTAIQLLQWITFASLIFWLLVYWQAGWKIFVDIQGALKNANSRMDTVLLILMTLCTLVITLTALLIILGQVKFGLPRRPDIPIWWTAIGCILAILGFVGTLYCRIQLGKFWNAETGSKKEQRVMDRGVYGVIRHPIYTFAIILYIGLGIVFPTWWDIICAAVVVLSYMIKAKNEETFLEKNMTGYMDYKKRVRYRVFPRIW
jgi:protein-S-isoprenylcysteine O-methyltransferase Ste14